MANKFLTNIELDAGLVDGSNSTGTSGYLLSSTGTATSWVDPAALAVGEAEQVHIACKNTSGVAISKGDPVYITGTVGTSYIIQIAKADASNSAKMPAVGLAESDLAINAEGFVIVSGVLKNLTTDPLSTGDGTPSSNDTVYVKAGGGLTRTKPTGSGNLIQNVGKVGRVSSANSGSLAVSTIMRTNDVPNLTTGKIWVGSSTYTTESTVVHLDEANGRMGINANSPLRDLHVVGNFAVNAGTNEYYGVYIPGSGEGSDPSILIGDWHNASATLKWDSSARSLNIDTQYSTGAGTFNITGNDGTSTFLTVNTSGNVGIGTTSPTGKLNVNEENGVSTVIISRGGANLTTGTALGNIIFPADYNGTPTDYASINAYANALSSVRGSLDFKVKSTSGNLLTGMTVYGTSAGINVGIGTTNPATKLVVSNGGAEGLEFSPIGGVGNDAFIQAYNRLTSSYENLTYYANNHYFNYGSSTRMIIEAGGNVGIGTTSPSSIGTGITTLDIEGSNAGGVAFGVSGTKNYIYGASTMYVQANTTAAFLTSGTEKMRITSGGNVGIGETSVDARLHITTASSGLVNQKFESAGSAAWRVGIPASQTYFAFDNANDNLSAPKVVIDSDGDIGIGTTDPLEKLHIRDTSGANIILNSNTFNVSSGVYMSEGPTATPTQNGAYAYYDGVNNAFKIATGTTSLIDRLTIARDSGALKLNQYGSGTFTGTATQRLAVDSSGNVIEIPIGSGPVDGSGTANYVTKWSDSDTITNSIIYDNGTNVGIGTTSPSAKLVVKGADSAADFSDYGIAVFENQQTEGLSIGYDTDGNYSWLYSRELGVSSRGLRLNGSLYVASVNGNVGIGTTSPDYNLDVAGAIGINTYIHHNDDTDTFIGFASPDVFVVNVGNIKQLNVTDSNVEIKDTLSFTYPGANNEYNGEIVTFGTFYTTNGTIAAGDVIVYTQAGINTGWFRATGNTTYGKGMLGIAMGTTPSAGILIKGFARNAVFTSGTGGAPLYISASSAGDTTSTPPSSTNNIVRIVGYMLNPTNDEIFFDPDKSWVQVS